jgi:endonuclease/exonuclease/phosphatase family metal-dependent hydrolase
MGFDYLGKVDYELYFGLAMFVRTNIAVKQEGEVFVYRERDSAVDGDNSTLGRNLQYVQFENDKRKFTIVNFHGLWNGKGKVDAPERIEQSQKAKTFLDSIKGAKILCGDFNLLPDTKSIGILEQGMTNLVKKYDVTSTRSHFYTKPEKFADYILISPEVKVLNFEVLQDAVSDHLPLTLEFS